jgi:deoxyribonuclease V
MILAVDVDYSENTAFVAGVLFSKWEDVEAKDIFTSTIDEINEYQPGSFYKRELPCILQLLNEHNLKPEIILVDGYVFLDGREVAGLGKYLFDALDDKPIVIGVAKRAFKDISSKYAVYRGESKNPLYVTSVGLDIDLALKRVSRMHGKYRIPELLKKVDHVCRGRC